MDTKKSFKILILVLIAIRPIDLALAKSSMESPNALISSENPSTEEVRNDLKKLVAGKNDFIRKFVRRLGNNSIEFQAFIAMEGAFDKATKILTTFQKSPDWALEDINKSPTGRNYYFKITGATPKAPDSLVFSFLFDLPIFKQKGGREFKIAVRPEKTSFYLEGQTVAAPESIITSCLARMYVYPADEEPNRLWVAVTGKVTVRPWILYEALPERILVNESTERLQTVINNYEKQEDLLRQLQETK